MHLLAAKEFVPLGDNKDFSNLNLIQDVSLAFSYRLLWRIYGEMGLGEKAEKPHDNQVSYQSIDN